MDVFKCNAFDTTQEDWVAVPNHERDERIKRGEAFSMLSDGGEVVIVFVTPKAG